MIEVYNSKYLTLEVCKEIKEAAKKAKACRKSYVPFVRALRKKDLEECVAIINGEIRWSQTAKILPYNFILNGRSVKYYSNGKKLFECNYVDGKIYGELQVWYN